jgi:SET domain-containing protein
VVDDVPHVALIAMRDIREKEELFYDYADRNPNNLESFPWLEDF